MLAGAVVFVCGGTRGIGRAVAAHIARNGANVAVFGTQEDKAQAVAGKLGTEHGQWHFGAACNVADSNSISRAFNAAEKHYGRVDALVNAAGA